jgi:hypothetical protein
MPFHEEMFESKIYVKVFAAQPDPSLAANVEVSGGWKT